MAEVELKFEDEVLCPHCGSTLLENTDKEVWYDGDDIDVECEECEYSGTIRVEVTVKLALWPD
jgi:DNA-directed RNA polymerase subunit RPC12/RpoP